MCQASWHLVCAGAVLAAVPPCIVFFVMQRHLVAGLTGAHPDDG